MLHETEMISVGELADVLHVTTAEVTSTLTEALSTIQNLLGLATDDLSRRRPWTRDQCRQALERATAPPPGYHQRLLASVLAATNPQKRHHHDHE